MTFEIFSTMCAATLMVAVWGWIRWANDRRLESPGAKISFAAFLLATLSILLAIIAASAGGFPAYDSRLLSIMGSGSFLSLAALICAVIGLWRPNSLRWHALFCSLGSLIFWVIQMGGE